MALQQVPLNLLWRHYLAWALLWAGRDADALAEVNRILDIDDAYFLAHSDRCLVHFMRGSLAEAIAGAERLCVIAPWSGLVAGFLAGLLTLAGKCPDRQIATLRDAPSHQQSLGFLSLHLVTSNNDEAAEWAATCIDQRQTALVYVLRSGLAANLQIQRSMACSGPDDELAMTV